MFGKLKKAIPDLIILDIMMAGKDGIQILKELKSNQYMVRNIFFYKPKLII